MPISETLLEVLCCPESKAALKMLPDQEIEKFNDLISAGKLRYADDSPVEKPLQEALITVDGKTLYRIDDDIPVMLVEKGIPAGQTGA